MGHHPRRAVYPGQHQARGVCQPATGRGRAWARGMLLQKSRLRRRALSQPPGPWPSVGEAPERDCLCSVVFGTNFMLRARGMNHDGYEGDFPSRKQSLPQTIVEPPFWALSWMAFCLSVLRWSSTAGLGWEERAVLSQSTAEACPPSVARSFPFSSFMSRLAPGWGRPEKFVQTFKIKDT